MHPHDGPADDEDEERRRRFIAQLEQDQAQRHLSSEAASPQGYQSPPTAGSASSPGGPYSHDASSEARDAQYHSPSHNNGMHSPASQQPMLAVAPLDKIKCVFLGDGAVGKTSLIVSYTTNGYPSEYVPTAIDTYDVVVHVDGEPVTLEMCDTPGQDDFDTLRPLVYPNTDVFLMCFSVVSPSSFANIKEKWLPEIKKAHKKQKHMPPVVLVGTQSDLRNDASTLVALAEHKSAPVTEAEAKKLAASLHCETYIESSSLTQRNLKEVFDEAIVAGIKGRRKKERRAAKNSAKGSPGGVSSEDSSEATTGCISGGSGGCVIL